MTAGSAVHTAYSVRPPAGIVTVSFFEYDTPPPPANVFQRERMYPSRVNPDPVLNVTLAPDAPVVFAMVPVPPFALYVICKEVVHTANNITGAVIANVSPEL